MKAKASTGKKCFFWHRWRLVKDTGFTKYHECKDCSSRRAAQGDGVYQPVAWDWLLGKTDTI